MGIATASQIWIMDSDASCPCRTPPPVRRRYPLAPALLAPERALSAVHVGRRRPAAGERGARAAPARAIPCPAGLASPGVAAGAGAGPHDHHAGPDAAEPGAAG